jgi:hypothetical protein
MSPDEAMTWLNPGGEWGVPGPYPAVTYERSLGVVGRPRGYGGGEGGCRPKGPRLSIEVVEKLAAALATTTSSLIRAVEEVRPDRTKGGRGPGRG